MGLGLGLGFSITGRGRVHIPCSSKAVATSRETARTMGDLANARCIARLGSGVEERGGVRSSAFACTTMDEVRCRELRRRHRANNRPG